MANGNGHEGDRLPPQNLEAERSVLGSIMLDNAKFREVRAILNVADFWRDAHQVIYQAMIDLDDVGRGIDLITVSAQLAQRGDLELANTDDTLEGCVNAVPHAANAIYYAELILEKSFMRRSIEAATRLLRNAYSNQFTSDEMLQGLRKEVTILEADADARHQVEEESGFTPLPGGMAPAAYRGIAGDLVSTIAEHTEACPEAIILQLLVAFGNVIGDRAHFMESGKRHRCNLYLGVVGPTGMGKGMAWDAVRWLMEQCNPQWTAKPLLSGMTSGEGLIKEVLECGGPVLALEEELARLLGNMGREGNSLSGVLRVAWERSVLRVPTKNNSVSVDNAYLSVIAHVTPTELAVKLGTADIENGLVNRFMWATAYLARYLPKGGDFDQLVNVLGPHLKRLLRAADYGQTSPSIGRPMHRDQEGESYWEEAYRSLRRRPAGPYGSATARAAPIVMRLAVIYAVLDRSHEVRKAHLESALACWQYCDQTAASLFGGVAIDRDGNKVLAALGAEGCKDGMTRTEINRKAFGGHKTPEAIDTVLTSLNHSGLIRQKTCDRGSNSCVLWITTQ